MKLGKFKFDFYGWLAVLVFILGHVLSIIHISFPFLSWIVGGFIYAQVFKKKMNAQYFMNAVITLIIVAVILFFASALIAGALGIYPTTI